MVRIVSIRQCCVYGPSDSPGQQENSNRHAHLMRKWIGETLRSPHTCMQLNIFSPCSPTRCTIQCCLTNSDAQSFQLSHNKINNMHNASFSKSMHEYSTPQAAQAAIAAASFHTYKRMPSKRAAEFQGNGGALKMLVFTSWSQYNCDSDYCTTVYSMFSSSSEVRQHGPDSKFKSFPQSSVSWPAGNNNDNKVQRQLCN